MTRLIALTALATLCACASSSHRAEIDGARVHTIRENYNNVHVIQAGGKTVLVDAGLPGDAARLVERVRELGVDPDSIEAVVVTHAHADHIGGAAYLRENHGARVVVGEGDRGMAARGTHDTLCPTDDTARGRLHEDQHATYEGVEADAYVSEERALSSLDDALAGFPGRVLPIAGHTPGSLVLVVGDAAFVGDMFRGEIVLPGATTHFYMCDLEDNRRDIRALLDAHPGVTTFFPGHFGPVSRAQVEEMLARPLPQNAVEGTGDPT